MPMPRRSYLRVQLAKVGTHSTSTGRMVITAEDLKDMAEAARDPLTGRAVIKIGHVDPRYANPGFDGDPVYGQVENLQVDGDALYGDLVNIPHELAEAMPSMYPSRSVEVAYNLRTRAGKVRRRVLTAVSLLGATRPAIADLHPVAGWANASAELLSDTWEGVVACAAADDTTPLPTATITTPPGLADHPSGGNMATIPASVAERLGLTEEQAEDEEQVLAALERLATAAPPTTGPPATLVPTSPAGGPVPAEELQAASGSVLTPAQVATFAEMEQRLTSLTSWQQDRLAADHAAEVDRAVYRFSADPVDGGRITPHTEPLWRAQLERDLPGTVALLSATPRLYSPSPVGSVTAPAGVDPAKAQHDRAVADAKALGLRVYENTGA